MTRAEDQAVADVAALLGQAGDWAARAQGLAQLREFAETHEPELVADAVGILIPQLADMLKELRSALLGDCCDTIAALVQRLGGEPLFKRELPLLVAELMRLPATNSVIFTAANNCLQTIVAHSTSSRMMGIVAEVCKNRHNHRLRARAVDCALQMMLQWPVSKLRKHDFELEEVMRSGCTDSNAHVRAASRRGACCLLKLGDHQLEMAGHRLLDEVEPGVAELIAGEDAWVEEQLQECTFGVGDGAAPINTEEYISKPVEGPDPKRTDFRPKHVNLVAEEAKEKRREESGVTSFQMRQLVKTLTTRVRDIIARSGTRIKDTFNQFDTNGDGVVDPQELRAGLEGMDIGLSAEEIEQILAVVDVNGDGGAYSYLVKRGVDPKLGAMIDYTEFAMLFGKRDIQIPGVTGEDGVISTGWKQPKVMDQPVSYHGAEWLSVDAEKKLRGEPQTRPKGVIVGGGDRTTLFGQGKTRVQPHSNRRDPKPPPKHSRVEGRVRGTFGAGKVAVKTTQPVLPPASARRSGRGGSHAFPQNQGYVPTWPMQQGAASAQPHYQQQQQYMYPPQPAQQQYPTPQQYPAPQQYQMPQQQGGYSYPQMPYALQQPANGNDFDDKMSVLSGQEQSLQNEIHSISKKLDGKENKGKGKGGKRRGQGRKGAPAAGPPQEPASGGKNSARFGRRADVQYPPEGSRNQRWDVDNATGAAQSAAA